MFPKQFTGLGFFEVLGEIGLAMAAPIVCPGLFSCGW